MLNRDELDGVLEAGGRLIASDGTDLGSIDQLVLDSSGAAPAFVSVRAGFFGIAQRFVPLEGASLDGSAVHVAFDADAVRSAPRVASDRGGLSADQAAELRQHYGLPADSNTAEVTSPDAEVGSRDAEVGPSDAEITSPDTEIRSPEPPSLPGPNRSERPLPPPAPRHHELAPPPMVPPPPGDHGHDGPPTPPPHPGPPEPRGPRPQR
jgi:hypothetical protein